MFFLEKGYTLLELVVVIALLTGLSTVLLLNSGSSRDVIHLNNAAVQLESILTQVQAYGQSGKAFPEGETDITTNPYAFDKGYGVFLEKDSSQVIVYGGLGDTSPENGVIEFDEEKYKSSTQQHEIIELEGGVEVSSIVFSPSDSNDQDAHIHFRRGKSTVGIHAHSSGVGHNNKNEVRITLSLDGVTSEVVVNNTGLIYIVE